MVGDASADDLGAEAWAPRPLALRFRREPSGRREAASAKIQAVRPCRRAPWRPFIFAILMNEEQQEGMPRMMCGRAIKLVPVCSFVR